MPAMLLLLAGVLVASSLVVHELGHWVALRRVGIRVSGISLGLGPALFRGTFLAVRLFPVGAALHMDAESWAAAPPASRFFAAMAGPAANLLFASVLAAAGIVENSPGLLLLAELNLWLACINLLPVPPFDGWQAALAATERWSGQPVPTAYQAKAARLGNALVYAIGATVLLYALTLFWRLTPLQ